MIDFAMVSKLFKDALEYLRGFVKTAAGMAPVFQEAEVHSRKYQPDIGNNAVHDSNCENDTV
jgi:hypothetical protein